MNHQLENRNIFSVSRLNREASSVLQLHIGMIWIEGEISNFAAPASGHWYFSLKDANAQVKCAMFKNSNRRFGRFGNGEQVLLRARVALYEPRGDFQLIAEHIEPAGLGALQQQFEALKQKLAALGLFKEERKRAITPLAYRRVGIISSANAAALKDALSVLKRRRPDLEVLIFPSMVQGQTAPKTLIQAIEHANLRADCDCLLLVRGGGSLEDLWAFNDEALAHAISQSAIPIVSGVGHEIDFTIADFVADLRAPTPSVAAEAVSFDADEIRAQLAGFGQYFARQMRQKCQHARQQLQQLYLRLEHQHPQNVLNQRQQRIDELQQRLVRQWQWQLARHAQKLAQQQAFLAQNPLRTMLQRKKMQLEYHQQRLVQHIGSDLPKRQQALAAVLRALNSISPLATLERGYSIALNAERELVQYHNCEIGQKLNLRGFDYQLCCQIVEKTKP